MPRHHTGFTKLAAFLCLLASGIVAQSAYVETSPRDPRTGESKPAGRFPNSGAQPFSTPDGWEDALLVLE